LGFQKYEQERKEGLFASSFHKSTTKYRISVVARSFLDNFFILKRKLNHVLYSVAAITNALLRKSPIDLQRALDPYP